MLPNSCTNALSFGASGILAETQDFPNLVIVGHIQYEVR